MRSDSITTPWSSSTAEQVASPSASLRMEGMVRHHLAAVWRTARDLGVSDGDREDVSQEVLMVALRRLSDIEPGRERAFLLATTVRVVANWRRGRRRRPAELKPCMDEQEPLNQLGTFPNQADVAESKQGLALVSRALDEMTEPQRVAFTLFELEQLSGREIARELGLSEATVFARLRRARIVFRGYCAKHGGTLGEPQ